MSTHASLPPCPPAPTHTPVDGNRQEGLVSRVPSCNLVSIPYKTRNLEIFKSFNSSGLSFPIHKWGE